MRADPNIQSIKTFLTLKLSQHHKCSTMFCKLSLSLPAVTAAELETPWVRVCRLAAPTAWRGSNGIFLSCCLQRLPQTWKRPLFVLDPPKRWFSADDGPTKLSSDSESEDARTPTKLRSRVRRPRRPPEATIAHGNRRFTINNILSVQSQIIFV